MIHGQCKRGFHEVASPRPVRTLQMPPQALRLRIALPANKLLEVGIGGERLDIGTQATAVTTNPELATVGALERT